MTFKYSIQGGVSIEFPDKPPVEILQALKSHGFRFNRGTWYRRRVDGAADFITWMEKTLNPPQSDGACWQCGAPGKFRHRGAAAPVLCDACAAVGA